jgi:hypothetical protein
MPKKAPPSQEERPRARGRRRGRMSTFDVMGFWRYNPV